MVGSRKYSLSRVERVEGRKRSPSRFRARGKQWWADRVPREMAEVKVGAKGGFSREREVVVVGVSRFERERVAEVEMGTRGSFQERQRWRRRPSCLAYRERGGGGGCLAF